MGSLHSTPRHWRIESAADRLFSALASGFEWYLYLDSEAMVHKRVSFRRLFEEYRRRPFALWSMPPVSEAPLKEHINVTMHMGLELPGLSPGIAGTPAEGVYWIDNPGPSDGLLPATVWLR